MTGPRRISESTIRREFIAYLQQHAPDVDVEEEHPDRIVVFADEEGPRQLFLHRVYSAIHEQQNSTLEERTEVYRAMAEALNDNPVGATVTLEDDGQRLRPRIVNAETLRQLQQVDPIPQTSLGDTGLSVVYVLDSEHSVAFLTERLREQMGIELDELHEMAVENLRDVAGLEGILQSLEPGSLVRVLIGDSYDAARVLLIPKMLSPGEQLAAAIPDRDTLVIMQVDDQAVWRVAAELARLPASDRLIYDHAIRITPDGIMAGPVVDEDDRPTGEKAKPKKKRPGKRRKARNEDAEGNESEFKDPEVNDPPDDVDEGTAL
jgi:hypothetical protein